MQLINRKDLRAPARVLDVELAAADRWRESLVAVEQYNTLWCLSRIDGVPQEISFWDVTGDASHFHWGVARSAANWEALRASL